MNEGPFEIERRFLIRYPDPAWLRQRAEGSRIVQTYLARPEEGGRARVRMRCQGGVRVYTHTVKTKINAMRRVEREREIGEAEYQELLKQADPKRRTIEKERWCLPYQGQMFEIDLFPFWSDRALMEIELEEESQPVDFPPEIEILREVTEDKRYTNASLAKKLPEETF